MYPKRFLAPLENLSITKICHKFSKVLIEKYLEKSGIKTPFCPETDHDTLKNLPFAYGR
jgi:hypothetical protein